jgi:phosphatidylinositol glycan class A protein
MRLTLPSLCRIYPKDRERGRGLLHCVARHIDSNITLSCLHGRIKVVVISRLVYRKGVDLLVGTIPIICKKYPHVDFIIGGDGSKKILLDELIERERLQGRVTTLGAVPHKHVPSILTQGHIFLNCSLTESFCIAILEAASCGLYVVSTNVGGIPEVLPQNSMMRLSDPTVSSMSENLSHVIKTQIHYDEKGYITTVYNPYDLHKKICTMYSWGYVARKTVAVYSKVINLPRLTFWQRSERYKSVGKIGGYIACMLHFILFMIVQVVEWYQPRHLIDTVPCLTKIE